MIVDLSGFSTGLCDRLRQVTFCAALAQLESDLLLEIYESVTMEGPYSIVELLVLEGFELRELHKQPENQLRMTPQTSQICMATVRTHKPKSLNVSDGDFLLRWRGMFRKLRPIGYLPDLFQMDLIGWSRPKTIGIHVRLSDRLSKWPVQGAITETQYKRFVKVKIPWIIRYARANDYSVFLAADNLASDETVRRLLRDKVKLIEYSKRWASVGVRNTDGHTFLCDLFGLSNCKNIFSTTGGGVPYTAALIGGINEESVHIWTEERWLDRAMIGLRKVVVYSRVAHITKGILKRFVSS